MAREIEKKYLVQGEPWTDFSGVHLRQGYICSEGKATVRIRTSDTSAWLTIKDRPVEGSFDRMEHEYSIPLADANEMLDKLSTSSIIEKTRSGQKRHAPRACQAHRVRPRCRCP